MYAPTAAVHTKGDDEYIFALNIAASFAATDGEDDDDDDNDSDGYCYYYCTIIIIHWRSVWGGRKGCVSQVPPRASRGVQLHSKASLRGECVFMCWRACVRSTCLFFGARNVYEWGVVVVWLARCSANLAAQVPFPLAANIGDDYLTLSRASHRSTRP